MVLKYGIGMLVVIIILSTEFNSIPPKNLLLFIGIISIVPFACWYIDRDFKNKVNSEYEIVDEKLIITVNGKQKTTELKSIKAITKIPSGHRIISNNGIFYILDEIENKEDLMTKLKE
ncbi:hypothetical protein FEM08_24950 [Flavobacterium gilvum]|nr:hypothetical protein FEM08_24950 [Flavobacterium gilvum]